MNNLLRSLDRSFLAWAVAWSVASLVAFGCVSAIIPNPVFGRQIPPEPFAIAVWLLSAPLIGLVAATYTAQPPAVVRSAAPLAAGPAVDAASFAVPMAGVVVPMADAVVPMADAVKPPDSAANETTQQAERQGTTIGMIASIGAFLAIGCPVCNKIALVLLGTGGALTVFAPIQPFLGAASLVLLAGTLAWRLRLRVRGGGCAIQL